MWQGFKNVKNMDGGYIAWVNKRFLVKVEHKELKYDELWFRLSKYNYVYVLLFKVGGQCVYVFTFLHKTH